MSSVGNQFGPTRPAAPLTVPRPGRRLPVAELAAESGATRLDEREVRRRIWHILPGFLPFILWLIPHRDPISWDLKGAILGVVAVLAAWVYLRFREIRRTGERDQRVAAVLGYSLSIVTAMFCFQAHAEISFTVLALLAFGDGCATLGGLLFGGARLPWNRNKTVSGLLSFITCGTLMGGVIYWGEANPKVPLATAMLVAGTAAVVSALAESLPSKINDNIRVGICAVLATAAAHWAFVGF